MSGAPQRQGTGGVRRARGCVREAITALQRNPNSPFPEQHALAPGFETGRGDVRSGRTETSFSLPSPQYNAKPRQHIHRWEEEGRPAGTRGTTRHGSLVFLCHYPRLGAEEANGLETPMGTDHRTPTNAALSDNGPAAAPPCGTESDRQTAPLQPDPPTQQG